jgi:guanylate kinase
LTPWKGLLVVISSPSGGGKTTIIQHILNTKQSNTEYSISITTRPPRSGEINGRDYFFVTKDDFENKITNKELIEWEEVHGYYYGTPKNLIEKWLQQGKSILMDIDVKGALTIRKKYPQNALLIFLEPPSMEILIDRLIDRASDKQSEIKKRLEAGEDELAVAHQFDHIVINDDLQKAVEEVTNLISLYKSKL